MAQDTGNRILHADGTPFHGRGANLHDERSCSACSFAPRQPAGVNRWADELIDGWHANFIRFLLAAKAVPYNQFEQQWMNLVDDAQYLADIKTSVNHMSAKPNVYILVTLFADSTIKGDNGEFDSEWPSSLGDGNTTTTRACCSASPTSRTPPPFTRPSLPTSIWPRSPPSARSRMRTGLPITSWWCKRPSGGRATSAISSPIR